MVQYLACQPLEVSMKIRGMEFNGLIVDLCAIGIAVETRFFVPCTSVALITFTLLTRDKNNNNLFQKISAEGIVMNIAVLKKQGYRLGIQFTKMSLEDKAAMSGFIKQVPFD